MKCFNVVRAGLFTLDDNVISDCLWTIEKITSDNFNQMEEKTIEKVAQCDVLHQICEHLLSDDTALFVPALKALGNITAANDKSVVDRCLFSGALTKLGMVLKKMKGNEGPISGLMKEVCWCLSNITAGSVNQVDSFVNSSVFEEVLEVSLNSKRPDERREALWVLCNAITGGSTESQIKMLELSQGTLLSILVLGC